MARLMSEGCRREAQPVNLPAPAQAEAWTRQSFCARSQASKVARRREEVVEEEGKRRMARRVTSTITNLFDGESRGGLVSRQHYNVLH